MTKSSTMPTPASFKSNCATGTSHVPIMKALSVSARCHAVRGGLCGALQVRVLLLHNGYQFAGGEDVAVAADQALLHRKGHETRLYHRSYEELQSLTAKTAVGMATQIGWSRTTYRAVRKLIRDWKPDVAHFHNIFPLISPSGYAACRAERVPTVQTLHNYRLICPAGTLLRDAKVCELCVGHVPWHGVRYACYRGSRAQSLVLASSLVAHGIAGTWRHRVNAYIALTHFGKRLFVRGGLPENRIFIRANAMETPEEHPYAGPRSAVYVGRLSPEKGLQVLLNAWTDLPEVPLTIIGGGPLLDHINATVASRNLRRVEVTGELPHRAVLDRIRTAGMLIFPSLWYEGLSYSIIEALAHGVPVVAANIGAQPEIIEHEVSGLLFAPGDASSLSSAVRRLRVSDGLAAALAAGARREFLERFSAETSYRQLLEVYQHAGAAA